jgi:hypothetical protein
MKQLLRMPFKRGRLLWTPDNGEGLVTADQVFSTHLRAIVRDKYGKMLDDIDLGSGLVTNVGVNAMANDPSWVAASTPFSTLSAANFHGVGTGATAAALTDFALQTPIASASLTGSTNGYYTGTQSVVAPNSYQTQATITANATLAVTEWGLALANAANLARTSAGAAPTTTTFTDTAASYNVIGNGLKGYTIEIASAPVNTPTTTVQGLITANTATGLTLANGWWTLANAAGATPGATIAYNISPTFFDHRSFSVINIVSGNTIQFIYDLAITSGG